MTNKFERFEIIDIKKFIPNRIFSEKDFRASLRNEDWEQYRDKRVLVQACGAGPVPPWAYMLLMSYLGDIPGSIAYGETCEPVVVHKRRTDEIVINVD